LELGARFNLPRNEMTSPCLSLPCATPARRRSAAGLACQPRQLGLLWCWTPGSRPTAVRLVNWVCPPAFTACDHVACRPDILLGVVLAVEPPAPPYSDIACEALPGSHGYPLLLQLCGPSVIAKFARRSSRAWYGSGRLVMISGGRLRGCSACWPPPK